MPETRFATTADGVRIAYSRTGSGWPLVFARGWITHLDEMWRVDAYRAFCERLATRCMFVRYDHRGNGLSDRAVDPPDLDALCLDLAAVVDAVDDGPIDLWGSGFGGPIAMHYAAAHPERVRRLVLDGTFAAPVDTANPEFAQRNRALVLLLRNAPEAAFASLTYVSDPAHDARYDERVQRLVRAIEPDMLERFYVLAANLDVTDDCKRIVAPTIVVHRLESQVFPLEASRRIASTIDGAAFIGLPGSAHNPWEGDAAAVLRAVDEHLALGLDVTSAPRTRPPRRTAVLLFTDLVDSTATTGRLGDDAARVLVRFHDDVVRRALDAHDGSEVKHLGDGIFASFASVRSALDAATEIRAAFAHRDHAEERLDVRIGVNAGEPIADEGDYYGTAVNLAARLCAYAKPGEVLVSSVVRDLAAGTPFVFERRERATLKGFPEPVTIYALAAVGARR